MNKSTKKLYMREHSNVIRKWSSKRALDMQENQIFNIDTTNRIIVVTICRIRQRVLSQAWQILVKNTKVEHDYEADLRMILSRKLPDDLMRTELEIEVMYKWILQTKDLDPTGIANTIYSCKKKSAVFTALQQMRLEYYDPGEIVLYQGDFPRPEDGHFTILAGNCDVLQFPEESVALLKVLYLAKRKKWDEAKKILNSAQILAKIYKLSGFGELSTLTGVKRAASIRTSRKPGVITEILVLPKQPLLDCLKYKRGQKAEEEGASPSEAIDFMRQSGLANRISPKDLVLAAGSMIRRTLLQGDILYYKGDAVKSMYLVVSGELLLDTGNFIFDGKIQPFLNSSQDTCFPLSSGSILGDEGVTGENHCFESTAVVVSDAAVVFEAVGFGLNFLTEKICALRYCALSYKDKTKWSAPIAYAEEINPYTYFNSLRKCIAYTHPFRGSLNNIYGDVEVGKNYQVGGMAGLKAAAAKMESNMAGSSSSASGKGKGIRSSMSTREAIREANNKAKKTHKSHRMSQLLNANSSILAAIDESYSGDKVLTAEEAERRSKYPKTLNMAALNHALELNKTTKKTLHNYAKMHARESILMEQILKQPPDVKAQENGSEEVKFKKNIAEYRSRAAIKAQKLLDEEKARLLAASNSQASTAIRFFSNIAQSGFDEEEEDHTHEGISVHPLFKNNGNITADTTAPTTRSTSRSNSRRNSRRDSRRNTFEARRTTMFTSAGITIELYEDATKLEQYFTYIDHLTLQGIQNLVQAQDNLDYDKLTKIERQGLTKQSLQDLGVLFQEFGLAPADLNIPWISKPVQQRTNTFKNMNNSGTLNEHSVEISIPELNLHTLATEEQKEKDALALEYHFTSGNNNESDKKASEKLMGKYKTYNPSSWREEMIRKKAIALETAKRFHRLKTYENRRVLDRFYVVPAPHQHHIVHANAHHPTNTASSANAAEGVGANGAAAETQHNVTQVKEVFSSDKGNRLQDIAAGVESLLQQFQYEDQKDTKIATSAEQFIETMESPDDFLETVKKLEFPKRKEHLSKYEWSTRAMRLTNGAKIEKDPNRNKKIVRSTLPPIANKHSPVEELDLSAQNYNNNDNNEGNNEGNPEGGGSNANTGRLTMRRTLTARVSQMHQQMSSRGSLVASGLPSPAVTGRGSVVTPSHISTGRNSVATPMGNSRSAQSLVPTGGTVAQQLNSARASIQTPSSPHRPSSHPFFNESQNVTHNASRNSIRTGAESPHTNDDIIGNNHNTASNHNKSFIGARSGGTIRQQSESINTGSQPAPADLDDDPDIRLPSQMSVDLEEYSDEEDGDAGDEGDDREESGEDEGEGDEEQEEEKKADEFTQEYGDVVETHNLPHENTSIVSGTTLYKSIEQNIQSSIDAQFSTVIKPEIKTKKRANNLTVTVDGSENNSILGDNVTFGTNMTSVLSTPHGEMNTTTMIKFSTDVLERDADARSTTGIAGTPHIGNVGGSYSSSYASSVASSGPNTPLSRRIGEDVRMKNLRMRLVNEKPASVALEIYNNYMNTPQQPRKYFEGKKATNGTSKFKLSSKLVGEIPEAIPDFDSALQETKHKSTQIALFESVYGNKVTAEEKQFVISHINNKDATGLITQSHTALADLFKRTATPLLDDQSNSSVANSRMGILSQLHSGNDSVTSNSTITHAQNNGNGTTNGNKNPPLDVDSAEDQASLEAWQQYTIESLLREKSGPKKTLPVLSTNTNAFTGSRKQFTGGRARRWGAGSLIQLAAESEESAIAGPPSYLEVYKSNFKIKSSAKERNKIAQEFKTKRLESTT